MKTPFKMFAIAAIATVSASALTVPAMADPRYDRHDRRETVRDIRDDRVDHRIDRLENRLADGRRSGRLTRSEFSRLAGELRTIENLSRKYERTGRGIDRQEMAALNRRLDQFETRMRWERNDRDNRNYGWRN